MKHINSETGKTIDLTSLSESEKKFYAAARKRFQENVDWIEFQNFAFGIESPIYAGNRSHLEVKSNPLFQALLDMALQLGIQQGMVAQHKVERETIAQ